MQKKKDSTAAEELAQQIIKEYQPENVADMQDVLKDVFDLMFEAMLNGEMTHHFGFESNNHDKGKATTNRRNGYIKKTVKTITKNES